MKKSMNIQDKLLPRSFISAATVKVFNQFLSVSAPNNDFPKLCEANCFFKNIF